ncbi:hypothetical protein BH23ACT9_BH23ACT9_09640 [soil metagenome]
MEGDKQDEGDGGHLPAVNRNVRVIGQGGVAAPAGTTAGITGRVADVAAHGNYAYLTAFRAADCLGGGFWTVDISDPANPSELAFVATTPGSYAGEGAQVFVPEYGEYAGTPLFIHQNETCTTPAVDRGPAPNVGGFHVWDVSDPAAPELVVRHAGDFTNPFTGQTRTSPSTVHSAFAWNSHVDEKAYVVLVDNVEFTDVDIMDITDPANPVMVNDTLDLVDLFGVDQESPAGLTSIFNHDMMVYKHGDRFVMNVNYWDGGYVLLDVTDPTPGNVTLIAETDYAELDEERLARGHEISPEGNAHQSEISPDFRFMIGTDEDFNPFRVVATITSGPYSGTGFSAVSASGTPPITTADVIAGTPTHVGLACDEVPAGSGVALIERGVCAFQVKLDNITAAGYSSGLVFNSQGGCDAFVRMAAGGGIPFLFIQRTTGLQILGATTAVVADPCNSPTPAPGEVGAVDIRAVFDGWGYVRLFGIDVPKRPGATGSIQQIDTYAIPESQEEDFATGFGDLSVHEVAMDPRRNTGLAYLSYYAGGLRVVEYDRNGLREVGAFIDEGGNNFWGVEVHRHPNGEYYVLASDRDFGLYILQYDGRIRGNSPGRR